MIEENKDMEFYIAIENEFGDIIYKSNDYKLGEMEFLNLIKICFVEERSKWIGRRLMAIYRDCTKERDELTIKRLSNIGVKINGTAEPTKTRKAKYR